jgi:AcrR family transcriptional regulator
MPRLADHPARRAQIVEALWRVIRQSGIAAVSVRSVAAEANISPTAMRYYFATQDELLEGAMRGVVDRVALRVQPLVTDPRGRADAEAILRELLPLDQIRREEQQIYLTFAVSAQTDPRLRIVLDETRRRLAGATRAAVDALDGGGELGPGRDPRAETERLLAVIDGLAFQAALWPRLHPARTLRQILAKHLDELATSPPTPR